MSREPNARDRLIASPILFFCFCAVVAYFAMPYIKAALGTPDFLADNHSGAQAWDPFGIMPKHATAEPVPGAERHYREIPAPGGIGWDGHQRFFGIDDSGPRPPRRHYRDGGEGGWR